MAGFVNANSNINLNKVGNPNPVRSFLKKLSTYGMDYNNDVIRNIRSIPIDTNNSRNNSSLTDSIVNNEQLQLLFSQYSNSTSGFNLGIANEDSQPQQYLVNRDKYRQFSIEDDVDEILGIVCDESIVFTDSRKFANININYDIDDELRDELTDVYNKIYSYFGFHDLNRAWHLYRNYLIDGFLAFEIVYNTEQTQIISFIELDPTILTPSIDMNTGEKVWIINQGDSRLQRVLYDSQIILIKYAQDNMISKTSYVSGLIRSFNVLRIMEATRIIFAVTNASYKMQYIIPVGSVASQNGKKTLAETAANHREIVDFDWNSGEIKTNGKPMLQFYKQIFLASSGGEVPQIQTLGGEGPQLNDTEALKYFKDKLRQASKIPSARFERDTGGGNFTLNAEGILQDEIRFSNFINRLRDIFQEILIKPVYIQMCLNHKQLITDKNFKVNLYLKYNNNNCFAAAKEAENLEKRAQTVSSLYSSISTQDDEGNQHPYFDLEFLVQKYLGLTEEELQLNESFKKRTALKKKGYKDKDIDKIILHGANEKDFKPDKKAKEGEEETVKDGEPAGEGGAPSDGGGASPSGGISGL